MERFDFNVLEELAEELAICMSKTYPQLRINSRKKLRINP
jgi:hypothetical protein